VERDNYFIPFLVICVLHESPFEAIL